MLGVSAQALNFTDHLRLFGSQVVCQSFEVTWEYFPLGITGQVSRQVVAVLAQDGQGLPEIADAGTPEPFVDERY